jgi:DNA-binding GntR family transcriptional regulator
LKAAIRDNVLPAGYQGSEQEIATRLGMSRTPVHEALIRLQEEGLIAIRAKRGVVVCALTPDDMREVYDVVMALEAKAAELIATKPLAERQTAIGILERFNADMRSALLDDDLDLWARGDDGFHRALVEQSGNRRLSRLSGNILDQSHRARMITLKLRSKPDRSVDEHAAIIAAIKAGDAARAAQGVQSHRTSARDELIPLLAKFGMTTL